MMCTFLRSFKITPRKQNAHAYINGAFKFDLDDSFTVTETPSVVFGGYGADLVCFYMRLRSYAGQ